MKSPFIKTTALEGLSCSCSWEEVKVRHYKSGVPGVRFLTSVLEIHTFLFLTIWFGKNKNTSSSRPGLLMAFINKLWIFSLALFLLASPLIQVARCQSDSDEAVETTEEVSDIGIVGDDVQDFGDGSFPSAPGIDTICVFPKNSARLVTAGEETELLVGVKNDGDSSLNVVAVKASVHLPFDHRLLVQNLTAQVFNNGSVPASTQATFQYIFAVSKFLQAGTFDLVGTIVYEIDQHPYQNTFYNGTIEVVEAGVFLSIESVFLVILGVALLVLLGLWIHGQIQHLSKKTKRAPKVEVGTRTTDASMDEWLQGTAYTQSLTSKSKKKK